MLASQLLYSIKFSLVQFCSIQLNFNSYFNLALSDIQDLTASCSREVKCAEVSGQVDLSAQRPLLMEKPDIVIGTPSRLLAHLQAKNLTLK